MEGDTIVMQDVFVFEQTGYVNGVIQGALRPSGIRPKFVDKFEAKYGYKPEWGAEAGYMQIALWADAVETAGTFYPPEIIKAYESGKKYADSIVGPVSWRAADHQLIRPVIVVKGKKTADMKGKDDYYDVVEIVAGDNIMQDPTAFGCKLASPT